MATYNLSVDNITGSKAGTEETETWNTKWNLLRFDINS